MLFHEIYGAYFMTVARILREAADAGITEKRMLEIVGENAFAESSLVIPEKLKSGEWPLLKPAQDADSGRSRYVSLLSGAPARPLTMLEKQWLKALLDDPRIRLFCPCEEEGCLHQLREALSDVPPLYEQNMFDYYDRYADGDDYASPEYMLHFRRAMQAIREKRLLYLDYTERRGKRRTGLFAPLAMEYSSKDDKFRLLCRSRSGSAFTINISRILLCEIRRPLEEEETELPAVRRAHADLLLTDRRNALNRAMLHFSDLQKETEKLDEKHYRIRLYYQQDDETELLIRILAFGPLVRVTAPDRLIGLIRERIEKQERLCGL